jgi:hypothetical protein
MITLRPLPSGEQASAFNSAILVQMTSNESSDSMSICRRQRAIPKKVKPLLKRGAFS